MDRPSAPHRRPTAPEDAALARAAVDDARLATLVTYGRHPSRQSETVVDVRARDDGSLEVELAPAAPAVRQLLARPLATVHLAPPGHPPVLVHGAARRLPGRSGTGPLVFHVEAAAVRLGEHCRAVDPDGYAAGAATPVGLLDRRAPYVLAHVNAAHADLLLQQVRAAGHDAVYAAATALDARGLTVVAVGLHGAAELRLPFVAELARPGHLPAALSALLTRRCDCRA